MIIGFDGSRAFIKNKTGTENYSFQLLHNLSLIDQKNTYFVYVRPGSTVIASEQRERGNLKGEIASPPMADRNDGTPWPENFNFITIPFPRLWTQVGLSLQTFKDPLDVLFVPAHTLPVVRKPGLKTVMTIHDLGAEYLPAMHQLKQRLYLNYMTYHQLKSASRLIAVSEATKKDLVDKVQVPSSKVTVVYEGYDKQLYKPVRTDIQRDTLKQFDLKPQSYFLFVGTIQPRKNIARLIEAYASFLQGNSKKNLYPTPYTLHPKLVLVGSKGWLSDEIYKLPKDLGIEDQVKFLGFVPDSKLPSLYSGAIALLFPSLFEGFGLPVLEAMAVGCPVLTSNTSSLPEAAGDAAILVDPTSTSSITKGIKRISQVKIRQALIKKGFEQVKRFSWKQAAQETLQLLTS